MKHYAKALAEASDRHRIITALVFACMWFVLEYILQYHTVAHVAEVFALSPMADRAIGVFLGE